MAADKRVSVLAPRQSLLAWPAGHVAETANADLIVEADVVLGRC